MYCQKCGEEILDEAVVCPKCGCETGNNLKKTAEPDEEKTGIGVLLGLFLGIIGLIIGLCLFKEGTVARKSFLKAWGITFGITVVIAVIAIIIYINRVNAIINDTNDYLDSLYDLYK